MRSRRLLPLLLSLCLLAAALPSVACGEAEFARARKWSARVAAALDFAAETPGAPEVVARLAKLARPFADEMQKLKAADFSANRARVVALFSAFANAYREAAGAGAFGTADWALDLAAVLSRLVPRIEQFLGGGAASFDLDGDVRALELSVGR